MNDTCDWIPLMEFYKNTSQLPATGMLFRYTNLKTPESHTFNLNRAWRLLLEGIEAGGTLDMFAETGKMEVCV